MIIIMETGCTQAEIDGVQRHLNDKGLQGQLNQGVERTVIGVLGQIYPELQDELELSQGVREVLRVTKPYKLASREFAAEETVVRIGEQGLPIGADNFVVFAGPCAVESEEQVLSTARAVKSAGAQVMRGGAFKPRTSPYSFRGLGEEGLKMLAAARDETGLPIITEVMSPRDMELVSRYADVLQIGARNMQNYALLDEAGAADKPVMVKRGLSATYEDWLLAAEYVMSGGNKEVILCERGIRTFETFTRNTMDLNAIPAIRRLSHLPVVADPSHGTGKWYLVTPMARAAAAVGADGLIIEVHPNPDEARSDGAQSLTFENFSSLMVQVTACQRLLKSHRHGTVAPSSDRRDPRISAGEPRVEDPIDRAIQLVRCPQSYLAMLGLLSRAPQSRRTLMFGSAMHVWSDLYFALMIPLLPFIKDDLGLSFKQVALLRSLFTGSSAILQIPAGFLAETVGEFWPLVLGNVWVAAGLVGMALSPILAVLLAASFLGGLGGATQHPLASSMVSRAYDDRGRSTAVGTVNFSGDLGKMVAPIVGGAIAINLGWRAALWIVGAAGLVFMALSTTVRRTVDIGRTRASEPNGTGEPGDNESATLMGGFIVLSGVGFLDSAVRGGSLVFLPFVMTSKDMSPAHVSTMLVLLFAGGAVGKYVCGWLGERQGIVSLIWGTKGLTALLLGLSLLTPPIAMAPLMVVLGIGLNGTSTVLYATVAEFVPPRRRARLYGVYYTTNEGGTVAAPLLLGVIADSFGLRIATLTMSLATAAILPASLALRKYTSPRAVASHIPGG